ncbi:MAG: hypothetical protein BZ151_08015 [Desulfobacca sp. 4484_104]|nr:MAG: hypothetical protein BZ151_08015 [Desulfobacca sp. 4484_104]
MLGLSATPWRRDGLTRLIYWYLGSKVYEIDRDNLVEDGHILAAEVIIRRTDFEPGHDPSEEYSRMLSIIRRTDFEPGHDPSEEYSRMLSELTEDPDRNALIAGDVVREARNGGGVCLVLTDRKAHGPRC